MKTKKINKQAWRNFAFFAGTSVLAVFGLTTMALNQKRNTDSKDSTLKYEPVGLQLTASVEKRQEGSEEQEYKRLLEEKEKLLKELEVQPSSGLESLFDSLESLNAQLLETHVSYVEFEQLRNQVNTLTRTLENAEQDVTIASEKNWTLGKEIMLYLFGLKFLWGFTTGFAPTTSVQEPLEKFIELQEKLGKELQAKTVELQVSESRVRRVLAQLETLFEAAINKSTSAEQRAKLLTSKLALTNTFNQLLVAGSELDTQEALYREYFRYTLPTTPFAVASARGVSQTDDHVGKFRFASLTEARTRKKMLEAKLAALFSVKGVEGLAKVAPAKLLAEVAVSLKTVESKKAEVKARVNAIEAKLKLLVMANPELSKMEQSSTSGETKVMAEGSESARVNDFLTAVESLRKSAGSVQSELESLVESQKQMQLAVEQVALREEALREATRRRHSFFRELTLYLLGFKFLWGAKTGFAPTVNVEKETQALNLAKEYLAALEKYQGEEMTKKEGALKRALTSLTESYRVAKSKAVSATQKAALTKYFAAFQDAFEKYRKEVESAERKISLVLHDSVAESLYTTHTSGFVSFLRNFGVRGGFSKSISSFSVSGQANTYNAFGVLEGDGGPVLSLDFGLFESLKAARSRFENFVVEEGEEILAEIIKEL